MSAPVTVAVDANGADLGPREVAAGAALAAERGVRVLLFGPRAELMPGADGVAIVDAPVSVAKDPDPVRAVRQRADASIAAAARAVAAGDAGALVSGGSTGAALAAGFLHMRRARGIHRPALALPIPIPGAPVLLLDVGANTEVRSEHLVQFAFMGAAFARAVMGVAAPRVGLLSNGEEPGRGTPDVRAAHEVLARGAPADGAMRFVGNVEGTQVADGVADVVVTDGFTGNVTLKLMEGIPATLLETIGRRAATSWRGRVGEVLLRPSVRAVREEIDPERSGGAYLLGLRQLGIVCHGRFGRRGFARAIELAAVGVREDVIGRTHATLQAAGALRSGTSEADASVAGR